MRLESNIPAELYLGRKRLATVSLTYDAYFLPIAESSPVWHGQFTAISPSSDLHDIIFRYRYAKKKKYKRPLRIMFHENDVPILLTHFDEIGEAIHCVFRPLRTDEPIPKPHTEAIIPQIPTSYDLV